MRFVLMIIGNDPDELLTRYQAFDGTNEDVRYVKEIDITDEILESISKWNTLEGALRDFDIDNIVSDESMLEKEKRYIFRCAIVKNGSLVKAVDRRNPNSKFDECWIGCGREGFFLLKPHRHGILGEDSIFELEKAGEKNMGRMADQAYKKDIDFEETRNRVGEEAKKVYEKTEAFYGGFIPKLQYLWDDPIYNDMSHEEKIKHCHNQEAMRIVDKANYSIHNIFATPDIEMFQGSKENFIQDAKKKALSTHAVLTKNGWYEIEQRGTSIKTTVRGKIVERWGKVCNDLIDSASDDTLLTVCTCHI